jgi:3-carboxy-cis,cis-muconate cycloisomerase
VTFGLFAAGWLAAIDAARRQLVRIRAERLAVQFGGAAGTLAALGAAGPRVAELLAAGLGLALPSLPWHTDRLRIVELAAALAGADAVLGKIARDVTLLAQSEVAEVREGAADPQGAGRRGGSSAMPHKRNPVASVVILGCTRQAPGLLATLTAAAEQEYQRAAGAWHAEWQPLADLLRLTGSAAAWAADLIGGLEPDPARMRANLERADGLPMAEHLAGVLAPALGRLQAQDLLAQASAEAVATGRALGDVLAAAPFARPLAEAGIDRAQIQAALDPMGYLGSAGHFVDAALAAHRAWADPGP